MTNLERYRRTVHTRSGALSCLDVPGDGPPVLFVHGVGTNGYLWRNVIAALDGERRMVAVDLPGHGQSPPRYGADLSLSAIAGYLEDFCDAAELSHIDLVANDTGGAIAQILATRDPRRLRTCTLTNCDTQGNLPPKAFEPAVAIARSGVLAFTAPYLAKRPQLALRAVFRGTYQYPGRVPLDVVRGFLEPVAGTRKKAREFARLLVAMDDADLRAIDADLRAFTVPTLLVWGTDDIFFGLDWAYKLRDTIPGVTELVEVPGGRLFFPDERAGELVDPLRKHWAAVQATA